MSEPLPTEARVSTVDLAEPPADLLADEVEDGAFYRAMHGCMPGFDFGYVQVSRPGSLSTVAPYFVTRFSVGTMLPDGPLKKLIGWIGFPIACVGSPVAAFGHLQGPVDAQVISSIADHLFGKCAIVSFKGFGAELPAEGFVRVDGLPCCVMKFDAETWRQTRASRNIRRKIKASAAIRFEERRGLPEDLLDSIFELYCATHARALVTFGRLTRDYFRNTSAQSIYTLAFLDDKLIGFAQIMVKQTSAVASFMGMDYSVNEAHGLYFAIVVSIMDIAEREGLRSIDLGETSYAFKKRIGCTLEPTWLYYRHRNPVMNWALARMAWILEPSEEELK
jgi:hypothetical protein